jgi:hypothetical protein
MWSSPLSKRAERWGGGGGGGRRKVIDGLGARILGSECDVRLSLRGRGLGVDCGVGRINVEKRFLREATPVMRGDSGASKYSSERISSGVNTN